MIQVLNAHWPAPKSIRALTTKRQGGQSQPPYAGLNLATHVGDDAHDVTHNRQVLKQALQLPNEPFWLNQTHSKQCVVVNDFTVNRDADAALTRQPGQVLAIMTADCLPILICNRQGNEIAAIHAGWRGLVGGIIENTLALIQSARSDLLVWLGPAMCGQCYATGPEVVDQYLSKYPFSEPAFHRIAQQWYADLPKIAYLILVSLGIHAIYASNSCTFEENSNYYSFRREAQTGRIATLIWFQEPL